jgi:pimeloyl-ACP methyl ester carboxylesterase
VLLRINGLETYYRLEGQGEPVVLLHGWGTSSQSLAGVGASLADGFRVLVTDLPGFGWSQAPPAAWGVGDYVTHVERLMDALAIGRASLVGHSFGGRISIGMSAGHPARVSRLVLVAGAGIRPRRRAGYYLRVGAVKLARRFFSLPGWGAAGQRVISRMSFRFGSRDYRAAGLMRPTFVKVVNEDLAPLLPKIEAPTLLVWGDQDREVPRSAMDSMAAGIPGARLVVFEGAGHFPFLDFPAEFQRALIGFLGVEGQR